MHYFFIGIGGISMSGLAEFTLSKGNKVSGSDRTLTPLTERLASLGAVIYGTQKAENIDEAQTEAKIDRVVYTTAISDTHPELVRARQQGIPVCTRAEFLGEIMRLFRTPIAVAGTHGKTTTTSMISEILLRADANPTISVGAILPSIQGNFRVGGLSYFVAEACEYTNSFLRFFPKVGVILNIEADHLDFFKDLEDIRRSFRKFAELLPPKEEGGVLVVNRELADVEEFTKGLACRVVTFGESEDAQYRASDVRYDENGDAAFRLRDPAGRIRELKLKLPGEHNVLNAAAAAAVADTLGFSWESIGGGLRAFCGAERRFQYKGTRNGVRIIDDYAHHPTEIRATLSAAKRLPCGTLWCVFQPHTYTRTKALLPEFAEALLLADRIVLAKTYAAREEDVYGVNSLTLRDEIVKRGGDCLYFETFEEIEKFLLKNCLNNDLLITMGAGNVVEVGEALLRE